MNRKILNITCPICNLIFPDNTSFSKHVSYIHEHVNDVKFDPCSSGNAATQEDGSSVCPFCAIVYKTSSDKGQRLYKAHLKFKHARPYVCTTCRKTFILECNLVQHMATGTCVINYTHPPYNGPYFEQQALDLYKEVESSSSSQWENYISTRQTSKRLRIQSAAESSVVVKEMGNKDTNTWDKRDGNKEGLDLSGHGNGDLSIEDKKNDNYRLILPTPETDSTRHISSIHIKTEIENNSGTSSTLIIPALIVRNDDRGDCKSPLLPQNHVPIDYDTLFL